jgi:hypothetical protein
LKKEVSPGIIAVTVVVVLALIGAVGYMVLGKHTATGALNSSNPSYQKYMSGSGSGGGSGPGHATAGPSGQSMPTGAGGAGSSGSSAH